MNKGESMATEKRVLIEIARTENGHYGAHAPDYPGCVAGGETLEETRRKMLKALEWHLESMLKDGEELPEDSEYCEILPVRVPELVHA